MIGSVSFEANVKRQRVQLFTVNKLDLKAVISADPDTNDDFIASGHIQLLLTFEGLI